MAKKKKFRANLPKAFLLSKCRGDCYVCRALFVLCGKNKFKMKRCTALCEERSGVQRLILIFFFSIVSAGETRFFLGSRPCAAVRACIHTYMYMCRCISCWMSVEGVSQHIRAIGCPTYTLEGMTCWMSVEGASHIISLYPLNECWRGESTHYIVISFEKEMTRLQNLLLRNND